MYFLHVEHKLKFSKYMRKKRKKIYCYRGLISSYLYPEVLWFSYLLPSLSSLLSSFSLSWSVASQHSARPADATSPANESLARLHGQRIRATRAWRGLDGSRSSCGTAANTGSAPISLHGDNIGRRRDGRALAETSNNLHSRL